MGDWCAEEGQHGVAHQAGDHALVFVNGFDHELERAVDNLRPFFRVEMLGGRGGALHVTKEHGDDTTLAHHSASGARRLQLGYQFFGDISVEKGLGRWSLAWRLNGNGCGRLLACGDVLRRFRLRRAGSGEQSPALLPQKLRLGRQSKPTVAAKVGLRWQLKTAAGTVLDEQAAAMQTEIVIFWVLSLAVGTGHIIQINQGSASPRGPGFY